MQQASPYNRRWYFFIIFILMFFLAACGRAPGESAPASKPGETAGSSEPAFSGARVQAADLLESFSPQPVELKEPDEAFAENLLRLGSLLLQKAQEEKAGENLLISPLSLLTALSMTANGAGGQTLKEMEQLLGGDLSLEELNAYQGAWYQQLAGREDMILHFANAIWYKEEEGLIIKDSFLQSNVNYYDAAIRKGPFNQETLQEINQWADLHTNHMIPEILDNLTPLDVMVLLNALCLEAKWLSPFEETSVNPAGQFAAADGKIRQVSMMGSLEPYYLADADTRGFSKEYEGGYSFVALLPEEGISIRDYIASLSGGKLMQLLSHKENTEVRIGLPKFSYDFNEDFSAALIELGMPSAFYNADFSGMTDSYPLVIDKVIHKTHIDVDSAGTRAAAVTAVVMRKNAVATISGQKEVILDRPFVYLILDQNQIPLFMGAVLDIENP